MTDAPDSSRNPEVQPEELQLDPAQMAFLQQKLDAEQNLGMALGAGLVSSLAGAGLWAGITVATGYQIGFMAIGVGFLVGFAVRAAGKGVSSVFGVVGAVFALVGCALGNLLAVAAIVGQNEGVPFLDVLTQLDFALIQELMVATFSPMDLLFYGFAIYEGYRLSFREITPEDVDAALSGGGPL